MLTGETVDFENTPASEGRHGWRYASNATVEEPRVSIVTPFFNTGAVFGETARSVFRQSWQSWEWIIVDDGSTDSESLSAINSVARQDDRVRILHLPRNAGLSAARNRGLAAARGEFVAWLDSDDLIEPTFLEKCIWRLHAMPQLAFTKGFTVGFGASHYIWRNGFHDREIFLRENRVDPTSLVRAAVCREIGGFDETIREGLEDWDFWLHAADCGHWGDTITEPLNWYRRRNGHEDRWRNLKKESRREQMAQKFRDRYPRLWRDGFPKVDEVAVERAKVSPRSPPLNSLKKDGRRLLFILPHLELGGADCFNLDVIRQMTERFGWEISVVTTRRATDAWSASFYDITSDVFMLHRFLPAKAYPEFIEYLIESRQPDVVLLNHSEMGYRLLPWLKALFPGLPVIDVVHIVMENWLAGGYPRLSLDYREFLTSTITSSYWLRDWMIKRRGRNDRIEVVHTNIDADTWLRTDQSAKIAREHWQLPANLPVIVYPARFTEQKNPRLLGAIVTALKKEKLPFLLLLVGDGPEQAWLEENVCRPHRRHVRMLGSLAVDDLRILLSAADLLLLPSRSEGIAVVLFEALSMGVVPVATAVGGQSELVADDRGILLPLGENLAEESARALIHLLRNPAERMEMARRVRSHIVTNHRLDDMGRKVNEILALIADSRPVGIMCAQEPTSAISRAAKEAVSIVEDAHVEEELWAASLRAGKWMPQIVSWFAAVLRRTPGARRIFRRVERDFGTKLGRIILGKIP